METRIRLAGAGDAEWVVARHGELYAAEFGFDGRFADSVESKMSAWLARPPHERSLWIAEATAGRTGSIALSARDATMGFLNFVLVCPHARGQGLGRLLLAHALGLARQRGLACVRLETYSCLTRARALYRAAGFTLAQREPDVALFGQRFDREFWHLDLPEGGSPAR